MSAASSIQLLPKPIDCNPNRVTAPKQNACCIFVIHSIFFRLSGETFILDCSQILRLIGGFRGGVPRFRGHEVPGRFRGHHTDLSFSPLRTALSSSCSPSHRTHTSSAVLPSTILSTGLRVPTAQPRTPKNPPKWHVKLDGLLHRAKQYSHYSNLKLGALYP